MLQKCKNSVTECKNTVFFFASIYYKTIKNNGYFWTIIITIKGMDIFKHNLFYYLIP